MPKQSKGPSRTGLSPSQLAVLQSTLTNEKRGKIVHVSIGRSYGKMESVPGIAEWLTELYASRFAKTTRLVSFVFVGSKKSNAYVYWYSSFDVVCITSAMAKELDHLAGELAWRLVQNVRKGGGFSFLDESPLTSSERRAAVKSLLLQGAVAFVVGHEFGHLAGGYDGVAAQGAQAASLRRKRKRQEGVLLDQFLSGASAMSSGEAGALRSQAHELDADVQGMALAWVSWEALRCELDDPAFLANPRKQLLREACSTPERMLLLACTGAAIALSLFGYRQPEGDGYPLTAVRCIVGLGVLNKMFMDNREGSPLELSPESTEALILVHQLLGDYVLRAAQTSPEPWPLAETLEATAVADRANVMLRATGIVPALEKPELLRSYLSSLADAFNECAALRAPKARMEQERLVRWS